MNGIKKSYGLLKVTAMEYNLSMELPIAVSSFEVENLC